MATLAEHVRAHLIANGVGRLPRTDDQNKPPIWVDPRDGAPAPNDQNQNPIERSTDAVITLFPATGLGTTRYDGVLRVDMVEIWIRTKTGVRAIEIERLIRPLLDDKRGWQMDGIRIEESLMFRALQRLGSDAQGFTYNTEYSFERAVSQDF